MSTEEQDAIVGRLVRERKQSTETLAAIEAKIKAMGKELTNFVGQVNAKAVQPRVNTGLTMDQVLALSDNIPTPADLKDVLVAWNHETDNKADLDSQLAKFGL